MTVGSSAGSNAAHGSTGPVSSVSSVSTQPVVPSSRATSSASTSARARVTAVLVEPSHHWMSAAVPGPKVVSQRRTSAA